MPPQLAIWLTKGDDIFDFWNSQILSEVVETGDREQIQFTYLYVFDKKNCSISWSGQILTQVFSAKMKTNMKGEMENS